MTPNRTGSTAALRIHNPAAALELRHPMPETGVASARFHEALGRLGRTLTEEEEQEYWTLFVLGWWESYLQGIAIGRRETREVMGR